MFSYINCDVLLPTLLGQRLSQCRGDHLSPLLSIFHFLQAVFLGHFGHLTLGFALRHTGVNRGSDSKPRWHAGENNDVPLRRDWRLSQLANITQDDLMRVTLGCGRKPQKPSVANSLQPKIKPMKGKEVKSFTASCQTSGNAEKWEWPSNTTMHPVNSSPYSATQFNYSA